MPATVWQFFRNGVRAIAGNGNDVNLLHFTWKKKFVKSQQVNLILWRVLAIWRPLCSGVASFSLAKVWPWWKATLMLVAKLRNLDCNMRNLWSLLVCRRRRRCSQWRHRRRFRRRRRQDDEQWGIRLVVSGPSYGGSWPSSNWWLGFQTALLGDEYCNICC